MLDTLSDSAIIAAWATRHPLGERCARLHFLRTVDALYEAYSESPQHAAAYELWEALESLLRQERDDIAAALSEIPHYVTNIKD